MPVCPRLQRSTRHAHSSATQVERRDHVRTPRLVSRTCVYSQVYVASSGAGLSGLSLALALQQYAPDVHFNIYEGASQLSEIGAGVGLHPRTWTIMQAMGLEEALLNVAGDDAESSEC